jgi:peptide/nickel transport system substrate-binding protein
MVFLTSPNNVYAFNKDVVFNPGRSAFIYLRDLEVTDKHWSVRTKKVYPLARQQPLKVNRQRLQESTP